jgi:hypothetical protein
VNSRLRFHGGVVVAVEVRVEDEDDARIGGDRVETGGIESAPEGMRLCRISRLPRRSNKARRTGSANSQAET